MVFLNQLKVLLWKNITRRWRNPILCAAELVWPLTVFILLVAIKWNSFSTEHYQECSFPPRALPSAGTVAFLTSYVCDFNNPCDQDATLNDVPGKITNFNDSLISSFMGKLHNWMDGASSFTLADMYNETFDVLFDLESSPQIDSRTRTMTRSEVDEKSQIRFRNSTETLNQFIGEVDYGLKSINKTISPFLANLLNEDGIAITNKLSDALCGKRRNVLDEHRKGKGVSDVISWMVDIIASEGKSPPENTNNTGLDSKCATLFERFERDTYSRLLWRQMKPMLLGHINFSPDNAATRKIIGEAARTFQVVDDVFTLVSDVKFVVRRLMSMHTGAKITQELAIIRCRQVFNNTSLCDNVQDLLKTVDDSYDFLTFAYNVIAKVENYANCFRVRKFIGQASVEALMENIEEQRKRDRFWAAIIFDNIMNDTEEIPKLVKYTIRLDPNRGKQTNILRDWIWTFNDKAGAKESQELVFGFSFIQDMIDHAIIRLHTNVSHEPGVYLQPFPYPHFVTDRYFEFLYFALPLFMVVSWTFSVSMIVSGIVSEKENRLKETLKIMGLGNGVNWLAWFINSLLSMMLSAAALCILLKVGQILTYSDPSLVFVFLVAFITCSISLAFFVTVFFDKSSLATVWAGLIFIATYLPDIAITLRQRDKDMVLAWKIASCISPTLAMTQGLKLIGNFEVQNIGAHWHNILDSPALDGRFSLLISIAMMLLDSFVLLILTIYIDYVFPGKYGIASPWNFFLQKSFWTGGETLVEIRKKLSVYDRHSSLTHYYGRHASYEPHKIKMIAGVAVRNLTKLYKGADRPAIEKLSLNFYEGQITSFLGHNGAGKTTTLSILTGLLAPTNGTAFINNFDIRTDIEKIRHSVGWCPQYNVLIDYLTVEEHVWLFGQLRRREGGDKMLKTEELLRDVGLWDKRNCKTKDLSGGMKRKLCVALAFVGGSTTVILDEPTAGVDPYSRRAIWEMLLKFKTGHTIILSTHHMDEADFLGDRIAIISNGKLRAVGSSLFLKDRFGSGYYLTLQKKEGSEKPGKPTPISCSDKNQHQSNNEAITTNQTDPTIGVDIVDFVQGYVKSAIVVENNDHQTRIRVPDDTDHGTELVHLLNAVEKSKDNLGIASYGISDTNLEEVFLKIVKPNLEPSNDPEDQRTKAITDSTSLHSEGSTSNLSISIESCGPTKSEKTRLLLSKMFALFAKRFHNFKRSFRALATQILVPVLFVCLSSVVSFIIPSSSEMPPLELQPWHLEVDNQPLLTFYSNDNKDNPLSKHLEKCLLHHPHYGTRCMDKNVYFIRGKPCLSSEKNEIDELNNNFDRDFIVNKRESSTKSSCSDKNLLNGKLSTNDNLYDLTGQNLTKWLITTESQYRMIRYGGFTFGAVNELGLISASDISSTVNLLMAALDVGAALPAEEERVRHNLEYVLQFVYTKDNIKVWVNNHGLHAGTSYVNGANNLLLRALLPDNETLDQYGIVTTSYPLKRSKESAVRNISKTYSIVYLTSAICILFAFSFVTAGFVVFLVDENTSNSKHLQILCGIRPVLYWIVNWMWDMINFAVSVVLCIFILYVFDKEEFVSAKNLPFFSTLLILFGWSVTPLMYLLSRFFKDPSSSFVILSGVNLFLGIISTLGNYIPSMMHLRNGSGRMEFDETMNQVLSVLPHFCLTKGILDLSLLQAEADLVEAFGDSMKHNLMDWNQSGQSLFKMFILGLSLNTLVLVIEEPWCLSLINRVRRRSDSNVSSKALLEEDVDLKKERQRVSSGQAAFDMLRLENLTKVHFGCSVPAVDRLCVGVPHTQCFGLLGVNGAGKSTTFKMLTGNLSVTSGDAFIAGHSISSSISQVRQLIGYCPQFDALNPFLTGREHLEFYAVARGVESAKIKLVVFQAIKTLGLTAYANKVVQSYSGGNKRKLSIAIALIGSPPVIFLDEPTAGMDPIARRFLWNCINKVVKSGRTVILTSHNMEECEALCNRLAIMVNGRFQSLGSLQHHKNRFGSGYTITMRVGGMNPDLSHIRQFIYSSLPSATLVEQYYNMLQYQLGLENLSLSKLFWTMERAKDLCGVEDYSVSETTLEQVFINFAKYQRNPNEISAHWKSMTGEEKEVTEELATPKQCSKSIQNHDDDNIISLNMFEDCHDEEADNIKVSVRL